MQKKKTLPILVTNLFGCLMPNRNPDEGVVIGSFEHHAQKKCGRWQKNISHINFGLFSRQRCFSRKCKDYGKVCLPQNAF